jgi:hypothetical protein
MSYSMLQEAHFLLKEMQFQQSNTGGCVSESLDQAIQDIEALKGSKYSDTELAAMVLEVLGVLFAELPELKLELERLAGLES